MKLTKEVKIGLALLAAITALIFGLNFLKGKNLFTNRTHYYALYDNIDGLAESNPVVINGFVVGQVDKIFFHPTRYGKIVVDIAMKDNDIAIPRNSIAKIFSDGVLGSKGLKLLLGDTIVLAAHGDTLNSSLESGLKEEVNKQILPLKAKAENLIASIDSLILIVRAVFNEEAQGNIHESFETITQAIKIFKQTTNRFDSLVAEQRSRLSHISANIESITQNLKINNEKITNILANFSSISDSLAKANIREAINHSSIAMKQAAEIMEKINSGKGTMGMLVNNDSLYNNLEAASRDLDKLLEDLRLHPKRYIHVSVFGKKDIGYVAPPPTINTGTKVILKK